MSRRDLLEIYQAGIAAADGRHRVAAALRDEPTPKSDLRVFAVGKAAPAMALGAIDAWGDRIRAGLVVTRSGYRQPALDRRDGWQQLEAAHPVPDETSLSAGDALLEAVARTGRDEACLFLISGGSSSLVEVLPAGVGLKALRRANEWLLASGLDIGAINAVRRSLSSIKDGRLAERVADRRTLALYLSDVPGDAPSDIGSGLLAAAPPTAPPPGLPAWLEGLCARSSPPGRPGSALTQRVVASLSVALAGCEAEAIRRCGRVIRHEGRLDLPVEDATRRIIDALGDGPAGIHLWGGETTLRLPANPGRGGRNQQLALSCALEMSGRQDLMVLCGATDGSDGPGEDAGGLVDAGTVARGELDGLRATDCLARADAGRFLAAAGDLVSTGPTGTNVNDLVVGLRAGRG